MWRVRGGWGREAAFEKRFGVFLGVTSVPLGDMKQPGNFVRALRDAGLPPAGWARGKQVHGRRVRIVRRATAPGVFPATDGLVTDQRNLPLAALVADCVPVFIVDPVKKAVGVVHAGWRGVRKNILARAVKAMRAAYGSRPGDLRVTLGPHIQSCCYEVGGDVACAFKNNPGALRRKEQKYFLDLSACLKAEANRLGMPAAQFSSAPHCTAHDRRFFSYRRKKTEERQAAVVVLL